MNAELRRRVLGFVASCALPDLGPGRYRYAAACARPTLYASCYAAMARGLLGELDELPATARREWATYLLAHQDADGLCRDPVIHDQGWYAGDPLWCGRAHLTCHVITALACLESALPPPLTWLQPWLAPGAMVTWLASRDWGARVAWTGNEVMNVGTLLQYARDYHGHAAAGAAAADLLDWLAGHHVDPRTGVWGAGDIAEPRARSHAVQAAYHWWTLFAYDGRPWPHVERALDTVLATQNPLGGFGWGVHNPAAPHCSSACEDIDSLDPLARMRQQTAHRQVETEGAIRRGAAWVLTQQTADGGFAFMQGRPFEYGHGELRSEADVGALFPTWFRLLSLALADTAVPGSVPGAIPWRFTRCPGMQFWGAPGGPS